MIQKAPEESSMNSNDWMEQIDEGHRDKAEEKLVTVKGVHA
jgi:hypothetical protein